MLEKKPHSLSSVFRSWIFVAYMIMAVYLVIDGAVIMGNRYSGRISTIFCFPNDQGQSECTITIHGFTENFQRRVLAKNVRRVVSFMGYRGGSDIFACGIDILTTSGKINFVHYSQHCRRTEIAVEKIVDLFALGESSPYKIFIYFGFHYSIFRRVFLLVVGLFIALWWGRSWTLNPFQKNSQDDNRRITPWGVALSWFRINILLKAFFFLSAWYISGILWYGYTTGEMDLTNKCASFIRNYHQLINWSDTSLKVLFCLYPLIAFAILQAYLQWKFLREMLPISGWWIGAPIIASLTLAFSLPGDLCDQECIDLKYLLSGSSFRLGESPIMWNLVFYLLLVGFVQWLVLRKRLSNSSGWVLMPLINISLAPLYYLVNKPLTNIYTLSNIGLLIILIILGDVVTSVFLSRVINSNKKELLLNNGES